MGVLDRASGVGAPCAVWVVSARPEPVGVLGAMPDPMQRQAATAR